MGGFDVNSEVAIVYPDPASVVAVDHESPKTWYISRLASLPVESSCYPAAAHAIKITNELADIQLMPGRIRFKEALGQADFAAWLCKASDGILYAYGMTVEKMHTFKKPSKEQPFNP